MNTFEHDKNGIKIAKKIIVRIVYGVVLGLIYYVIYLQILPILLTRLTQIPITISLSKVIVYLGFFLALGIAESILRNNPISIPIKILGKMLGALILFVVLNGGLLEGNIKFGTTVLTVKIDISLLLYAIILISLVYGFIDAFSYFTSAEK